MQKSRALSASAKCGVQWLGERRASNRRRLRVRVRWARGGRPLRAWYGALNRAVISICALVLNTHFTVHSSPFLFHMQVAYANSHRQSVAGAKPTLLRNTVARARIIVITVLIFANCRPTLFHRIIFANANSVLTLVSAWAWVYECAAWRRIFSCRTYP